MPRLKWNNFLDAEDAVSLETSCEDGNWAMDKSSVTSEAETVGKAMEAKFDG
jgi:hypothetical protein